jgi:hypothetical protein
MPIGPRTPAEPQPCDGWPASIPLQHEALWALALRRFYDHIHAPATTSAPTAATTSEDDHDVDRT